MFKEGDKVFRKPNAPKNEWSFGNKICTVRKVISDGIWLDECQFVWNSKFFYLAKPITMGTAYQTDKYETVRVLCTDFKLDRMTVIATVMKSDGSEVLINLDEYGCLYDGTRKLLLSNNYKKDDDILVSNDQICWYRRYFAEIGNEGSVKTYPKGCISLTYSGETLSVWLYHRKFKE